MTTVGLLSDTHGYFHPRLVEDLEECDLILHAGDVGDLAILDGLEAVAPVRAVWGNADGPDVRRRLSEQRRLEIDGLEVWLVHIAGRPGRWQQGRGAVLREDPPDVLVCGHSHILRVERVEAFDDLLYINPGAAGKQGFHERKTALRLHIQDSVPATVDVIHLDAEA